MKISLITAVYNREGTIADAMTSVASQKNADIEHLVIDGASTDGTLALVRAHAGAAVRLISEPDDGIYDALNKGLNLASGDIVGVLHSDDTFSHDGVVAQVAEAFSTTGAGAVYGDLDYVSAGDPERIVRRWRAGEFNPRRLRKGWMPPHPTLFLRRDEIARLGGYDTRFRISADYDLVLRYFGKGAVKPTYIPEILVKMRLGGESNRSPSRIFLKSREDYRALRKNGVGGLATLAAKNFGKLPQFVSRA